VCLNEGNSRAEAIDLRGHGENGGWRVNFLSGEIRPQGGPGSAENRPEVDGEAPLDLPVVADEAAVHRIKGLPKEVGVMLVSVGVLGVVLPGVVGAPAIVAGGLVLWPRAFSGMERWLRRRHPGLHHRSMQQIERYLNDLERRFPEPSAD
jgi:hypothetical protein